MSGPYGISLLDILLCEKSNMAYSVCRRRRKVDGIPAGGYHAVIVPFDLSRLCLLYEFFVHYNNNTQL